MAGNHCKTLHKKLNRKDTARTEIMGDERFTGIEYDLKGYRWLLDGGTSDE